MNRTENAGTVIAPATRLGTSLLFAVAIFISLLSVAEAARAAEHVWLEAETPTRSNVPVEPKGWGNVQYLSGGQWLHYAVGENEAEKTVPKGGATFDYEFSVPAAGKYELWDRIGFESIRTPFQWRIDEGPWCEVSGKELTTDLMEIAFFCEISWLRLGEVDLTEGRHVLHIRVPITYREDQGTKKPNGVNFTADAFCLYKGRFRPNSKFQPGEDWRQEIDRQAEQQVFAVKTPPEGQRSVNSLAGVWQVTRFDERDIDDRTGPMKRPPQDEDCVWLGIQVPGDKNINRPELKMCHRLVYRAIVDAPADAQGRSWVLQFPCNSMITTVFVNGVQCGWTRAPLAPWECDITRAVKPGRKNEIQVGIKDTYYAMARDTRTKFHLPDDHWRAQWTTEQFDFPVAGRLESGILLEPSLVVSGPAYAADVFAMPSVKNKQLTLEITLRNPTGTNLRVTVANEIVPLAGGPPEKTFAAVDADLPAGREVVIKPAEVWHNPKLWWPDDPQQYFAVTKVMVGDKVVDTTKTKFGFRQWEWDGPSLKLNGVAWHGRADTTPGTPAQIKQRGQNMVRLWGSPLQVSEQQLDELDAAGLPARWTGIFDGQGGAYGNFLGGAESLFTHYIEQTAAWVKGYRNHPSIFLWSIENEITYINARNWGHLDVWEPWAKKCWLTLQQIDPTRPVMVDGGRALRDKSLPIYGGHYEETAARAYPDEAYTLENMFNNKDYWYQAGWPIGKDKPIFIGESFYVRGYPPAWFAGLCGEKAFLGRAEAKEGAGLLLKMLTEGYRWNGITFQFWVGGEDADLEYPSWSDIALFCRQWNWTFGGGQPVDRTLKVFNDTRLANPIDTLWQLKVAGRVVQEGRRTFHLSPGTAEEFAVSFKTPPVNDRTPAEFVLSCSRGGKEVYREVKQVAILPADAAPKPQASATDLLVLDPLGTVRSHLARRGIAFTEVARFEDLPETGKVVVIGKDALDPRQATDPKLLALAAAGARVLVLEQQHPLHYLALPADLEVSNDTGRVAFAENLNHPVFAGLAQQDFFTWSQDHVVYRNAYRKASRGAISLVQCDEELRDSALAACPVNDGLLLVCQLVVGEKLGFDPVAQRLFDNLLNYGFGYAPVRKQTAVVMPADRPEAKLLAGSGLKFDTTADIVAAISDNRQEIVVALASPANLRALAAQLDKVRAFTNRGGSLMLWGLDDKGLADFNRVVDVEHLIRPFEMERVTLPGQSDALLSDLTMRDVVMESSQQISQWAGDRFAASDQFTSIVDVDDVAPFAGIPDGTYWGYDDSKPGWDHWPRNMFNGFTFQDSWKYAFTIVTDQSATATKWSMTYPRELEFTEVSLLFTPIFSQVESVNFYFDDDPTPVNFEVPDNWKAKHTFTLPQPRKAKVLGIELAEYARDSMGHALVGIDNMWVRVRRADDVGARIRPLLNIGGLVKYRIGTGCIVLNNLRVQAVEPNPVNLQKKQAIVSTLLRNMGATFAGGQTLVAGAGMTTTPVDLSDKRNQYLTRDKGWFDTRDLAAFPKGEVKLGGVTYAIRDFKTSPLPACIMLAGPGVSGNLPQQVTGIPVDRTADALFFLHALKRTADWQPPANGDRTPPVLFKYVVHFADGQTVDVPIRYAEGADHWISKQPQGLKAATVAWAAPFSGDASGDQTVVYQVQWNNPRPAVKIVSVDLTYDPSTQGRFGVPALLGLAAGAATTDRQKP